MPAIPEFMPDPTSPRLLFRAFSGLPALYETPTGCPECSERAFDDDGVVVCFRCGHGHVAAPAIGAIKPGRVSCLVPFCGRSWDPEKHGVGEFICGRHWRCVPPHVRARRAAAKRLEKRRPQHFAAITHDELSWEACKRAAVAGGAL